MLYTTGYLLWTPTTLAAAIIDRNAILVDIRFMPRSRHSGWNKVQLQRRLGSRYTHVQALGNRNYRAGGIDLVDLDDGLRQLARLFDTHSDVVLMCACRDRRRCHRQLVATAASRQLGMPSTELQPPAEPQPELFTDRGC